jgi:CheY-like chemotaxis protein
MNPEQIRYRGSLPAQDAVSSSEEVRPLVLVVDDEPVMRSVMMRILREHYRVVTSADGRDAFATFGVVGEAIAAVVTDVEMPRMDGLGLAELINHMAAPPPILFVSASRPQSGELPGPFLPKPFSPDALVHAVDDLLASKH